MSTPLRPARPRPRPRRAGLPPWVASRIAPWVCAGAFVLGACGGEGAPGTGDPGAGPDGGPFGGAGSDGAVAGEASGGGAPGGGASTRREEGADGADGGPAGAVGAATGADDRDADADLAGRDLTPEGRAAEDHPAVVVRAAGGIWIASVGWNGSTDRIELRSLTDASAGTHVLASSGARLLGTAAAEDGAGTVHVVWSEQVDDGWALRGATLAEPTGGPTDPGTPSPATTLVPADGAHHLDPVLATGADGRLLLAWQRLDVTGTAILGAVFDPASGWSAPARLSGPVDSAWQPAVCAHGDGWALIWDGAVDGDYDVSLAQVSVDPDGRPRARDERRVAGTPLHEVDPSVASAGDRLYVAWCEGPAGWGREGSVNKLEETLHGQRTIRIAAVEGGRAAPLAEALTDGMPEALAANCEQPLLHVDGGGNLVVLFRGLPLPQEVHDPLNPVFQQQAAQTSGGKGWRTSIWFSYWTVFDGVRWSAGDRHQQGIDGSEGRLDAPIARAALRGGGLAFAVVGDGRSPTTTTSRRGETLNVDALSWWRPVTGSPTRISGGRLRKGSPVAALPTGAWRDLLPARTRGSPSGRSETRGTADDPAHLVGPDGGPALRLALGDLHRHTDLSRCSSSWDGPFIDAFRYALDVAPLDFLAVTDHFEHMTAYDRHRSASWVDAYHVPGRLVNLHAHERADAWTGHRNLVSAGGPEPYVGYRKSFEPERDDARADEPHDLWAALDARGDDEPALLTIPHTPAGMFANSPIVFHWTRFEPRYDRVVELWQGYRGGSEDAGAPRSIEGLVPKRYVVPNLERGLHFGFVAASDHQSSDGAYAGAWVTSLDRAGVFEALHDRRSFAATTRLSLWTSWGGHAMGATARTAPGPREFLVSVDGFGRVVERIELVVDGELRKARPIGRTRADERFEVEVPAGGERFAYARVVFVDGELGWSSPIRLADEALDDDTWTGPDGLDGERAYQGDPDHARDRLR